MSSMDTITTERIQESIDNDLFCVHYAATDVPSSSSGVGNDAADIPSTWLSSVQQVQ